MKSTAFSKLLLFSYMVLYIHISIILGVAKVCKTTGLFTCAFVQGFWFMVNGCVGAAI